ncbi:unnamed protein product [Clonostachys chloroleuca]|uniref:Uncharacterized protein n=1 Tax=Clonostachys chloroleuca TaxID=1926264 RepID=A0AA35MIK9_9HYPO|nr:unnamed protein product [Clonostachys chloroleuca]
MGYEDMPNDKPCTGRKKGRIRQTWWRWRLGNRRRAERAEGEAAQDAESLGEGIREKSVDLPDLDPVMAYSSIVRRPSDQGRGRG